MVYNIIESFRKTYQYLKIVLEIFCVYYINSGQVVDIRAIFMQCG